jgi:hypothetical protein
MVSAHTWEVKSVGTALAKARGSGLMFNLNFLANLSCTGVPKANRLPQELKPALDVLARHGRRRRKADYAVREARINSQYCCVSNICGDSDAKSSLRPQSTLLQPEFGIRRRVFSEEIVGVRYVARLDERITVAQRISPFQYAGTDRLGVPPPRINERGGG